MIKRKLWIMILLLLGIFSSANAQEVTIVRERTSEGNDSVQIIERPTVTLKNRNVPLSVDVPGAKETFPNGEDVPKPSIDRPIVSPWDDHMSMPYACQAILNRPYYYEQMAFGQNFDLDVTFINTGTQPWDMNIDVMQYTGDILEKDQDGLYIYDIDSTYKDEHDGARKIVYPGESIRVKIPMRAPTESYHEDNVYYSAYTLVKNWNLANYSDPAYTPWDAIHSGLWGEAHMVEQYDGSSIWHDMLRTDSVGMFCPVYFYIYVP